KLHRPQTHTRAGACELRPRRGSDRIGRTPASEALQDIADKGARKLTRQAFQRGWVFLKETGEVARDLILLAEQIRRILVKHLALAVGERHFRGHNYQGTRGPSGL